MALLFDDVFPHGHNYKKIPWEITDNPLVITYIVEGMRQSCPEAVDVIAGLLNRLDSREIGLDYICEPRAREKKRR
ncbi:hypothetical protein ACLRDC_16490 [Gluconacetobacter sacchari]|uniref:Uncharacterized protein n=2 Tax=Gluconacetobacter sacchari TaxID=92759 RepID=A0A7W4IGT8_9PROT|nr:hypothetical protein [Gluconacetobacter sacchari]MBB2162561.1 hypothetical protein [Gluconacetobacter sacchari]GBQ31139.1 hypothetical protein AA12717_3669 [Gluconacetobacter sacchari DSM 12717]